MLQLELMALNHVLKASIATLEQILQTPLLTLILNRKLVSLVTIVPYTP
jgi:hypothetical protein